MHGVVLTAVVYAPPYILEERSSSRRWNVVSSQAGRSDVGMYDAPGRVQKRQAAAKKPAIWIGALILLAVLALVFYFLVMR